MNMRKLATVVIIALSATTAAAADATDKASYEAAKKQAATRYAEDKTLCAEETSSSARMQCLRDAKAEYKEALTAASKSKASAPPAAKASALCAECGKVTSVKVDEKKGESTPLGMIAGGVAGAVLGHQVGSGRGKDVATIAGAAGGAYAGHKIEEKVRSEKIWVVNVRFENGEDRSFNFESDPGYAAGDAVKQSGNGIARR